MAGSLGHIVDDLDGTFRTGLIENLGDAHEVLEECFAIIYELSGGDIDAVNRICKHLGFPTIDHPMVLSE